MVMGLIITDNEFLMQRFKELIAKKGYNEKDFDFMFSHNNKAFLEKYAGKSDFKPIKVKDAVEDIVKNYDLVFSLHCKQLFPKELVERVRCVNIHPGFNPYNRGWYPQVFSIINKKPVGATLHEIDEHMDHGGIIAQKEVNVFAYDTSKDVYDRVLDVEIELLDEFWEKIINNDYKVINPASEGNVNLLADFKNLCKLDLEAVGTLKEHIDLLRALTHGNFANAYFVDEQGDKIDVKIVIERAKD